MQNVASIVGRLTKDPEGNINGDDVKKSYVRLSVATEYYDMKEREKKTIFENVTVFGMDAKFILERCKKGFVFACTGTRTSFTKDDKTYIGINAMQGCVNFFKTEQLAQAANQQGQSSGAAQERATTQQQSQGPAQSGGDDFEDDDLPF